MKIKDIALSAAYVGQRAVKAICVGAQEVWSAIKYIVFKDPMVAQICAENWGDGSGLTEEDAAKVMDIGTIFKGTEIASFDEFEYFENVTAINEDGFRDCSNLASIVFPENIEIIGDNAFNGTKIGGEITLKKTKSIGSYAFICTNITKAVLGDSVSILNWRCFDNITALVSVEARGVTNIGYQCFGGCTSLRTVLFGDVDQVSHYAFKGCSNFEGLDLDNAIELGEEAFRNVKFDKYPVVRLSKIRTLGIRAIYNCEGIREIYVGDKYQTGSIASCANLTTLEMHPKITVNVSISGCKKLTNYNITNLRITRANAVTGCNSLTIEEFRLPNYQEKDTVTSTFVNNDIRKICDLGRMSGSFNEAFNGNNNLTDVTLPYCMSSIFRIKFGGRFNFVILNQNVPPTFEPSGFGVTENGVVYVPDESLEAYKSASQWLPYIDRLHPMSDFVTYEDVSSHLTSDVVYSTPSVAWEKFSSVPISEIGAKSMVYDVFGYGYLRIRGNGGTSSRLYCFLDENDEVITSSEESLNAEPLYIIIPSIAKRMVVNLYPTSSQMKVEIGKHIE